MANSNTKKHISNDIKSAIDFLLSLLSLLLFKWNFFYY